MPPTLRDIGIGLAAGAAGGEALKRTAQLMWENTDPKNKLREEAIEPRDPFIVLAQRVFPLISGKSPTRAQEKMFETGVMTALGAGGGIAYVMLAWRWLWAGCSAERYSALCSTSWKMRAWDQRSGWLAITENIRPKLTCAVWSRISPSAS